MAKSSNMTHANSAITASPINEDIWQKFDNFLLTPPQSPPVNFDLSLLDSLDESLAAALDDLLEDEAGLSDSSLLEVIDALQSEQGMDLLNDCMWSGNCLEDCGHSVSDATCNKPILGVCAPASSSISSQSSVCSQIPDPQLLSTCPMVMGGCSFQEVSCQDEVDDEPEDQSQYGVRPNVPMDIDMKYPFCSQSSVESSSSGFVSGSESLIDHSYDSPKSCYKTSNNPLFASPKTCSPDSKSKFFHSSCSPPGSLVIKNS